MSGIEAKAARERRREIAEHLVAVGRQVLISKAKADGHEQLALTVEQVASGLQGIIERSK